MIDDTDDAPAQAAADAADSEKAALWKETRALLGLDGNAPAADAPEEAASPEAEKTDTTPAAESDQDGASQENDGTDGRAQDAASREARQQAKPDATERENKGRIAALQREMHKLKGQLDALMQGAVSIPLPSAKLKAAADEYPEIAAPVAEALDQVHTALRRQQDIVAQQGVLSDVQAEIALEERFPGGFDLVRQNEPAFISWVDDQPRRLRDAFARNAERITDVDAAVTLLSAYRAHLNGQAAPPVTVAQATYPTADRRQRQIAGAAAPGRSSPAASSIPDGSDKEAIWKSMRARKLF